MSYETIIHRRKTNGFIPILNINALSLIFQELFYVRIIDYVSSILR